MTNSSTFPDFPAGTILGYPRIGPRRQLKKAVEAFWAGSVSADELEATAAVLRQGTRERLVQLGLGRDDSSIPESFSYYDQMLDALCTVGAVPARFAHLRGEDGHLDLAGYFTLARGEGEHPPLEMTKWFDTNYHYLVPEIGPETEFTLAGTRLVREFEEAKAAGFLTRPVIVGPVTFLLLSKPSNEAPTGFSPLDRLDDLVPVYAALLQRLRAAGAEWVQLDEPALVSESIDTPRTDALAGLRFAYNTLGALAERPALFVAAPYGSLDDALPVLAITPVEAIGLDLVRGSVPAETPGLDTTTLVAGIIDGHNIWRGDLAAAFDTAAGLVRLSPRISVSTSTSLLHVPHDIDDESALDDDLKSWLAFADQKVAQVATLARGLSLGRRAIETDLSAASAALDARRVAPGVRDGAVRVRADALTSGDFTRDAYAARVAAQEIALGLPFLPTTTIGSFPQTGDIRRARAQLVRGVLSTADYRDLMRAEIRRVVALQEDIGLDVIVHGEPERNDMVQYFAENLDGFAVTENGWVQSYGSRCVRPSILWGDVSRPRPITVEWSAFTQGLTPKPVKGMLTGPVTILAWSFVRDDQPLGETARQVALALRDEIADLETAGIQIVQVDEPALRELLPLKQKDQAEYLDWSVGSFRLATAGAAAATQIHTHLCYSEFGVVIDAIRNLDADVTSIEAARSRMEVVGDIRSQGFDHGIGPGVWDIHSPRVPSVAELTDLLERAAAAIPAIRLWVNPDCGLKTRGYAETVQSLHNMLAATRILRARLTSSVSA
ncbi:5-methyltetrahydropteroyltriglutamate--homocysteine S-methyltransferase [Cryobacterium sp. TMT2-18-3]|uniref:5-methyltetrahydropteroyltriglutamate-- homocysteine S-methyltransferase n=1 Tax=unclassified Cryobacterium TaxID=2649013 RepID=UPI00106D1093|nr:MULTISPECIES: 5-methyltetrahydropteroyltriglutamate--homocysteine S-methyltransferase [unclassified Cryobacterium]TFC25899.1 5-methyltetrahydropteroyltriglutamate--homocysteine S-methyltransferase [Cryobacterium sp. TMT2-18-2]TFC32453.1 5-methyltetrahydropteroyltriglutamate--homocysteine S-methyltransferase [Cryobacterium sp. TMT2-42-4]TFC59088.1 5-methyltetrahydropteroyltriglutamate--homocysteine S-methyltransferase [Cryobacterium sp. TMT2-15-1]TFC65333.1 5-methyltetrahydropteroyltriglutama